MLTLFSLTSCAQLVGFPRLESKDVPLIFDNLTKSNASYCVWIGGRGGAGGMAVTPTPVVPMGGYGSGELILGRINAPDTKITIENSKCVIERGSESYQPIPFVPPFITQPNTPSPPARIPENEFRSTIP